MGLRWRRQGLRSILERLHRGDKLTVVVAHRDRLARFGFELIEWLVEQNGGNVGRFSTSRMAAQSPKFTEGRGRHPAYGRVLPDRTDLWRRYRTAIAQAALRVYPNAQQKVRTIATWLEASRWSYNLTVEILQSGIPAVWQYIAGMVMAEVKLLQPEWEAVPYQVKRTAVRDAPAGR